MNLLTRNFFFSGGDLLGRQKKHLERIVNPDQIAAVELHSRLMSKKGNLISSDDVLESKLHYQNRFWLPSKYYLWQHAILNWQYEDNGMLKNFLAFRTVLDVLYLEPKDIMIKITNSNKATMHFYSLLSTYYNHYPVYFGLKKNIYNCQINSLNFSNFINFMLDYIFLFF